MTTKAQPEIDQTRRLDDQYLIDLSQQILDDEFKLSDGAGTVSRVLVAIGYALVVLARQKTDRP